MDVQEKEKQRRKLALYLQAWRVHSVNSYHSKAGPERELSKNGEDAGFASNCTVPQLYDTALLVRTY